MADQTAPDTTNQQWFLNAPQISQAPFMQSWNGIQAPFANQQDQIQQSLQISGVYPGQMPPNAFLGNTPARYAFGRQVPGTSPYVGALTNYMQGPGMQTGTNIGLLGVQNGIYGMQDPPNGQKASQGFPTGGSYSQVGMPYGGGGPTGGGGNPVPGQPAPPFPPMTDPRQAGGTFGQPTTGQPPVPPGAGQSNRGAFNTGMWNGTGGLAGGGLLGGRSPQTQQQLAATGTQALQGVSDPATRYMMAMAYHIAPASIGLTPEQINQYEQSTMGQTYNRKTGQVQRNY